MKHDIDLSAQNETAEKTETEKTEMTEPKKPGQKNAAVKSTALTLILCLMLGLCGGAAGAVLILRFFPAGEPQSDEHPVVAPGVVNVLPPETDPGEDASGEDPADLPPVLTPGQIYAAAVPSAVGIKATRTEETKGFFGRIDKKDVTATGSGFAVKEGGYLVTNAHVVKDAHTVKVTVYNGAEYDAECIGSDPANDIAVLKIDLPLPAVTFGSSADLGVGDRVYVVGNPLSDLAYTFTDGIVSYKNRVILGANGTLMNTFQTNAAINEGNSGGPVFDQYGRLVGISTAKYSATSIEGLGFCIPIDGVLDAISELIETGSVSAKPFLGFSAETVSKAMMNDKGLPAGCFVVAVEDGSPASDAGILSGDVIVQADASPVASVKALSAIVSGKKTGDVIELKINRGGASLVFTLTFSDGSFAAARTQYDYVKDF